MSLLMDALNKAEQAKRQGPATDAEASAAAKTTSSPLTLELTPLLIAAEPPASEPTAPEPTAPDPTAPASSAQMPPPLPAPLPAPLPELPAHLGVLDDEFIAHAATAKPTAKTEKPAARPAPAEPPTALLAPVVAATIAKPSAVPQKAVAQDREAAQNLFAAKQPAPPRPNKRLLLAIGLLAVLIAGAIGVYFWLQLQPAGGLNTLKPPAGVPRPPSPPAQLAPPPVAVTPPAAPTTPPLPANEPARPAAPSVRSEPSGAFHVTKSKLTLNPSLATGYEAYLASDYATAKNEYLQVLKNEPSNLDALHGMAAISLRQGQYAVAEEYYLRAIEADPKDALAQGGLIGLKSQIDPQQAETRLNALLAAQPELPFLHFTLGSLYARQNRWSEAQAAFFKAYSGEPDNPDTLFNLAVSLDHLHQAKLALQYYKLALAAAESRPASFDKAQVGARQRELQPLE